MQFDNEDFSGGGRIDARLNMTGENPAIEHVFSKVASKRHMPTHTHTHFPTLKHQNNIDIYGSEADRKRINTDRKQIGTDRKTQPKHVYPEQKKCKILLGCQFSCIVAMCARTVLSKTTNRKNMQL